jgi:hypothetical protein
MRNATLYEWSFREDRREDAAVDPPLDLVGNPLGCSTTLRNTRSKLGLGFSAPTSCAMSTKRFNCSGSSGGGLGLRGMLYWFSTFFASPWQANFVTSIDNAQNHRDSKSPAENLSKSVSDLHRSFARLAEFFVIPPESPHLSGSVIAT